MIKKAVILTAVVVLLGGLAFGRDLLSYADTAAYKVSESARNAIPLQWELDRARNMIRDLKPEIERSMHTIAKEEVAVERLEREIADRAVTLEQRRDQVMRLKDDLSTGRQQFQYAGRSYTADQVRSDLQARFANYQTQESTLNNLERIMAARQSGLEAARQKLTEMQSAKRQLEVEVENLDARLKMVQVAEAAGQVNFDDSHLARTRELIGDLSARLDVMSKLAAAETSGGEIPLDEPTAENIVDQVAAYFERSEEAAPRSAVVTVSEK